MAQEGLSQESIRQLAKVLEEAKNLSDRQLEIAEKVLEYEKEIGDLRIGYLKDFGGLYEQTLQKIATKQSQLGESFLVLQKRMDKFEAGAKNAKSGGRKGGSGKSNKGKTNSGGGDKSGGGNSSNSGGGGNNTEDISNRSAPGNYNMDRQPIKEEKDESLSAEAIAAAAENKKKAEQILSEMRKRDRLSDQEQERAILKMREEWEQKLISMRADRQNKFGEDAERLHNAEMKLAALRHESESDFQERVLAKSLSNRQTVLDAEIAAQNALLDAKASIAYATNPKYAEERVAMSNRQTAAEFDGKEATKRAEAFEKKKAQLELLYKRKNNGILTKEADAEIQKRLKKQFVDAKKNEENIAKHRASLTKIASEKANAEERGQLRAQTGAIFAKGASWEERKAAMYELTHDSEGNVDKGKALSAAILAVSDMAKQLEGKIDEIAEYKGGIDTRLQGSGNKKFMGSYWDQLVRDMTSVGAVNPFFKQDDYAKNIQEFVNRGISFDLKQRAFLKTISDKIASTFDSFDSTMLRLVRIQQEDSTAGRIGMESALNSFLNSMYETSEYLTDVASSVRGSLQEMEALMGGAEATEVEWQVQKWLGSLYSVGMSNEAVTAISNSLGQIAAGQIEGLVNGGAGNLLIMAANDAGIPIADVLTKGITADETNQLLQAAVNYLAELSDSAKDNKVVQQQLANVFGVKASDLRAATNLVLPGSTKSVFNKNLSYENMLGQLSTMAGSMASRTSVAEMMTNIWKNGEYTLAGSMASNPVSYLVYKMASVVDDAAGGIDLPFLNVMGFGVDLNTTVSDLMRLAAVGGGILGSLGPMISGLGSSFSGRAMLNKLGIGTGSGLAAVTRGDGGGGSGSEGGGAKTTSGSGYVGNGNGSDVKDSTIQESEDSKKQQMIEAKEEAEANQVDVLNQTVIKMYELLEEVASGKSSFAVRVEGYGLTKASSGGSQGGVAALTNGGGSSGGSGGLGGGVGNSTSVRGTADFGGWTTF